MPLMDSVTIRLHAIAQAFEACGAEYLAEMMRTLVKESINDRNEDK